MIQPDPEKQSVCEIDASDLGVAAVLSQIFSDIKKLQPCAFFSKRLSQAELNYDVGDRELLAIKITFESGATG